MGESKKVLPFHPENQGQLTCGALPQWLTTVIHFFPFSKCNATFESGALHAMKPSDKTENKNERRYPLKHQLLAKLRKTKEIWEDCLKKQPLGPPDMLIPTVSPGQLSFLQILHPQMKEQFQWILERVCLLQAHKTLLIKLNVLLREEMKL